MTDYKKLKRDPDFFKNNFIIKDNKTYIKEDVEVMFPQRYIEKDLCAIGNNVSVVSIYGLIKDDKYCLVSAPIIQYLNPYLVDDVEYDGIKYKVLYFSKDNTYSDNNELIKTNKIINGLFTEFITSGKIPWFINYEDVSNIFLETSKYADSSVGNDPLIMEILAYLISRSNSNKDIYFRYEINKREDLKSKKIAYVGLNNVFYSLNNTTSKLIGGYFTDALTSALVKDEETTSNVGDILRS